MGCFHAPACKYLIRMVMIMSAVISMLMVMIMSAVIPMLVVMIMITVLPMRVVMIMITVISMFVVMIMITVVSMPMVMIMITVISMLMNMTAVRAYSGGLQKLIFQRIFLLHDIQYFSAFQFIPRCRHQCSLFIVLTNQTYTFFKLFLFNILSTA